MSQIEKLTKEQEAVIPRFVEDWVKVGLSTDPVNKSKITQALHRIYPNVLDRKNLIAVIHLPSPLQAWLGTLLCEVVFQQGNKKKSQVWSQVGSQVRSQVESQVGSQVESQVWSQVGSFFFPYLYGQFEASWWAFFECCKYLGVSGYPKTYELMKLLTQSGPIWALNHFAIVSDRPKEIYRDTQNRLHKDGGPALSYRDGFSLYSFHGVLIPEDWGKLNSEHWKPQWLLETKNVEQRRVLIQGLGYERIKSALPSKTIHVDREMELVRLAKDVDVEPIVLLKVICPSTQRPYVLRVPPQMTTCESARRWTLHDESNDLQFLKET